MATGGRGPLRYSLSPAPPAGLSFKAATRVLSGRPPGSQDSATYTYTVSDLYGDAASLAFTIAIKAAGTDIEVPEDPPPELARVPRKVRCPRPGIVRPTSAPPRHLTQPADDLPAEPNRAPVAARGHAEGLTTSSSWTVCRFPVESYWVAT